MNTSPVVKIHTRVEELNGSLKVSQLIVHEIFFNFNASKTGEGGEVASNFFCLQMPVP
jgi:hypothetical protein